jgi:hypothetical protein
MPNDPNREPPKTRREYDEMRHRNKHQNICKNGNAPTRLIIQLFDRLFAQLFINLFFSAKNSIKQYRQNNNHKTTLKAESRHCPAQCHKSWHQAHS